MLDRDSGRPPLRALMAPFAVRVARQEDLLVAEVEGDVDLLTAPRLMGAVNRHSAFDAVVFDLRKVPFVSWRGLGLIASLGRTLTRRGGGVALVGLQPLVTRLLETVGPPETLLIAPDVPAAIALLTAPGDGPVAA
jgi:anti-anti-sigma factor